MTKKKPELLKVKLHDIADLKLDPKNVRDHPTKNLDAIKASLSRWGQQKPIVIDGDGVVRAGNGLLMAARALGWTQIAAVQTDLKDHELTAYAIADNRTCDLSTWAAEVESMIADLKIDMPDLDTLALGFDDIKFLLDESKPEGDLDIDAEPQIDRAEELRKQWGVDTGQLWKLGEHRLLCGDSTNAEDVARLMGGERASAVLCDPPYGQNQKGVNHDAPEEHAGLMAAAVGMLPIDNGVVVAFQSPRTFHAWTDSARAAGFTFERMLWLYKAAQCTFPWRGWILKSESIPLCSIGKPDWQEVHPFSHDCYYLSEVSGELADNAGWHGSVKPLVVVSDLLARICPPGAVVFDGFCGSGTTIIAAENLGRKCYAMEIAPGYVAVALQRWSDAVGKTPELIGKKGEIAHE